MRFNHTFITALCSLLPLCAAQNTEVAPSRLDSPEARQAAVEASLLPHSWARGHAFGMTERMRILGVPGVSVAVIHNGQIDWAAGYGVRDVVSGAPVTAETLFQAASISKSVSAMAALRLAQEGRFDLDAPINELLTSFKLPEADFEGEVTPRRILNHTAGLSVHGFAGYRTDDSIPTAAEVVAGLGNSQAVLRIDDVGKGVRYSGGGSTLLQVALMDLTGQDFASIVREKVLEPLGMSRSTYAQPLPKDDWLNHSAAHDHSGRRITGGFHVYPEQFPAGLWTTPSDIARFALEVQRLAEERDGQVLNAESGQAMLAPEFGRAALGLFIAEYGGESWFEHSGSNMGFRCDFRASFHGGHGVVVMTNGELGSELCGDVIRAVAKVYDWPDVIGESLEEVQLTSAQLTRYAGRYAFEPDEVVFVDEVEGRLWLQQLPYPRLPLAPLGDHRFQILGTEFQVDFHGDGPDQATSVTMSMAPEQHAERLAGDSHWPVQDLLHGDPRGAIAQYRNVLETDAMDPMVDCDRLIQLTTGLLQFGEPESGLWLARAVTDLYPEDAGAWDALGQAYSDLGKREASVKAYHSCLERLPDDASLDASGGAWLQANTEARLNWLEGVLALETLRERSEYAELDKQAVEGLARAAEAHWAHELSGFKYLRVEQFSAGGVSHWMSIWLHGQTGLEFVLLPGGRFQMGSPESEVDRREDELQHWVTLDPFLVARTECTRAAWAKLQDATAWKVDLSDGDDQLPVSGIGPVDVEAWCRAAGLTFPTEAQWEFMCRGGTTAAWAVGANKSDLIRFANLGSAECPQDWHAVPGITEDWRDGFGAETAAVGSFEGNSFGLFDVHGNLCEWCRDEYQSYEVPAEPGTGLRPGVSGERQARGGNFGGGASAARSAKRLTCGSGNLAGGGGNHGFGFRPSLDLPFPFLFEGWPSETFALPPGFAPSLPSGTESLRFAPGWRDPSSEDFWSYAFVMWIDETEPDAERIGELLDGYYDGLMSTFAGSKDIGSDPAQVEVSSTSPGQFEAKLHVIDAFATFEPKDLRVLVSSVPGTDDRTVLRVQLSPQAEDHMIWRALEAAVMSIREP